MKVFLSYSSEDEASAESIHLALVGAGFDVFFNRDSLLAGADYRSSIGEAIKSSDVFIFLVSKNSIAPGSYTLTELKCARLKWPHPKGHLIPVRLDDISLKEIPEYLKSVTALQPEGDVASEVLDTVLRLREISSSGNNYLDVTPGEECKGESEKSDDTKRGSFVQIWVAIIGMVSALGVAVVANWKNFFEPVKAEAPMARKNSGMAGQDAAFGMTPDFNEKCEEFTVIDYSKYPVQSQIVKKCIP